MLHMLWNSLALLVCLYQPGFVVPEKSLWKSISAYESSGTMEKMADMINGIDFISLIERLN